MQRSASILRNIISASCARVHNMIISVTCAVGLWQQLKDGLKIDSGNYLLSSYSFVALLASNLCVKSQLSWILNQQPTNLNRTRHIWPEGFEELTAFFIPNVHHQVLVGSTVKNTLHLLTTALWLFPWQKHWTESFSLDTRNFCKKLKSLIPCISASLSSRNNHKKKATNV